MHGRDGGTRHWLAIEHILHLGLSSFSDVVLHTPPLTDPMKKVLLAPCTTSCTAPAPARGRSSPLVLYVVGPANVHGTGSVVNAATGPAHAHATSSSSANCIFIFFLVLSVLCCSLLAALCCSLLLCCCSLCSSLLFVALCCSLLVGSLFLLLVLLVSYVFYVSLF